MPLSRLHRACVLVVLTVSLSAAAHAQTDRFPDLWSPDGRIEGMAVLGDSLFVSGRFGRVGPSTGQLAVLSKTTGEANTTYPPFDAIGLGSPGITAVVPDGAGGYYVGGDFSSVAEQPRQNLARVRSDGTLDPAFRPNPVTNPGTPGSGGLVSTLALDLTAASPSGAGVLYVGGRFETVGGQPREDLAALDAATGAVLPLAADFVQTSIFFGVESAVIAGGVVYVAGSFSAVGGQPRSGLAALDAATGAVLPWAPALTSRPAVPDPYADELALGETTLYVAGPFKTVNGQAREELAELTLADPATGQGGTLTPWAPTSGLPDPIRAFDLVVVGNDVFAAGTRLARIDRTTAAVTYVAVGLGSARALALDPEGGPSGQGTLYVGADRRPSPFSSTFPVVFAVDPVTGQPTGLDVRGATEGNVVNALAVEPGPGGRLFAGGTFITFGAGIVARQGLASLNLTTGRPTPFAATVAGPGQGLFEDLALSPDGRFLYGYSNVVGGAALRLTEYDLATGATREFIPQGLTAVTYGASAAAVPSAGSARAAVAQAPNPRVENATSALVVTDTRVCLSINGVACYDRATAARLFYTPMVYVGSISENNGDLVYLPPGGPVQGPGGAGGTLYLAALVAEAPVGTSRPALVAVDFETGAVLSQWTPGFDFAGAEGHALALFDRDGAGPAPTSLYAGGSRDWTVRGTPREALATFDPLTAALGPWAPRVSGGTASVLSMAMHRTPDGDGAVYVGGTLFFANGIRGRSAVAFDARVGVRRPWGEGVTGTPRVLMVSERHGAVFVGGSVGLVGTGHSNLVALAPAAVIMPTAGEGSRPESASSASLALAGPNPFRSRTALSLTLPEAQAVEASLFDVLGRRVAVLHDGPLGAGTHTLAVDASALPAGVYVARVTGEGFAVSQTLTVVR